MKKIVLLYLVVTLLLCGCGSAKQDSEKQTVTTETQNTESAVTTETETEVSAETEVEEIVEDQEETETQETTKGPENTQNNTGNQNASTSSNIPEEYYYCYDINRDSIVTEDEVDAYDKRFYAELPTSDFEKNILFAGYDTAVFDGSDYCSVMVKKTEDDYFQYGIGLLEEQCFNLGYGTYQMHGRNLDDERYRVSCYVEPLVCDIVTNTLTMSSWTNFEVCLFEKAYGYSSVTSDCLNYVADGYYDGTIGVETDGVISFYLDDMLKVCEIMANYK